jgi:hypothetical protein
MNLSSDITTWNKTAIKCLETQRLVFIEETFHSTLPGKLKQILLKTQYVPNERVIFA